MNAIEKLLKPKGTSFNESVDVGYKSSVIDRVIYADGSQEIIDHGHNAMLNTFLPLLTNLLVKGTGALKYWAVGTGDETWDTEAIPEIVTFSVTQACTNSGSVTINLGGVAYNIAILAGDSAVAVATKVQAYAVGFIANWGAVRDTNTIVFTSSTTGDKPVSSYNPNGTGAIGTMTITQDGAIAISRPIPLATQDKLVHEVYRKEIKTSVTFVEDGIYFLEAGANGLERVAYPTNIIEIQLTFDINEGLSDGVTETKWREFSIVGGETATAVLSTGRYMNVKNHGTITKTNTMIVERKIRFTFTNAN